MNSPELDELLSAYIDGLAPPQEIARIESDPALLARAEELRAAAAAVAQPVAPAPAATADAAIAAALQQSSTAANVTALAARPQPQHRRVIMVTAAAAVVAFGFLAGAFILATDDGSDTGDDLAASLDEAEEAELPTDLGTTAAEVPEEAGGAATSGENRVETSTSGEPEAVEGAAPSRGGADQDNAAIPEEESADEAPAESEAAEAAADAADGEVGQDDSFGGSAEAAPALEEFADLEALFEAIETGALELMAATSPLACDLEPPTPRPGAAAVYVMARLPEGDVLVTGWESGDGFDVDQVVEVETCVTLEP